MVEPMKRWAVSVVIVIACGGDKEPKQAPPPPPPPPADATPIDAAPPRLAAEREAFWAPLLGSQPGTIGPEARAYCRAPLPKKVEDHGKYVAEHVFLQRNTEDACVLRVDKELASELETFLVRWGSEKDFVDDRERLTVRVSRLDDGGIDVYWNAHVPLEEIIGAANSGVLVRGFDPKAVLGKPPDALKKAVDKTWKLAPPLFCDAKGCSADGKSPPGGGATQIYRIDARGKKATTVRFFVPRPSIPQVRALLDAALGPHVSNTHRRDGVRYVVVEDERGVEVRIEAE